MGSAWSPAPSSSPLWTGPALNMAASLSVPPGGGRRRREGPQENAAQNSGESAQPQRVPLGGKLAASEGDAGIAGGILIIRSLSQSSTSAGRGR